MYASVDNNFVVTNNELYRATTNAATIDLSWSIQTSYIKFNPKKVFQTIPYQ